jgi:sRNA-binding carbon storage regulator CsrA
MLVITRQTGESFTLNVSAMEVAKLAAAGQPINAKIRTLRIRAGSTRIGIEADKSVRVLRSELKAA